MNNFKQADTFTAPMLLPAWPGTYGIVIRDENDQWFADRYPIVGWRIDWARTNAPAMTDAIDDPMVNENDHVIQFLDNSNTDSNTEGEVATATGTDGKVFSLDTARQRKSQGKSAVPLKRKHVKSSGGNSGNVPPPPNEELSALMPIMHASHIHMVNDVTAILYPDGSVIAGFKNYDSVDHWLDHVTGRKPKQKRMVQKSWT